MATQEPEQGNPDQENADEERKASEGRYRRLFEDSQEGIAITTPEGEFVEVNPAAAEISGYSQKELLSMNAAELYVDPEERETIGKQLSKEGTISEREVRLRRASGEEMICELSVTLRHGEKGELYQTFFRDVTERKKAEKALEESEERHRRLFEESRDAVVLTTPEGAILDANGAAEELFGYSREELLRLDAAELYAEPEERGRRIVPEIQEASSSRLLEAEMRHSEGHTFLASASVTVHRGEEGRPELIQALVRDITERKQREEVLAEQKRTAERQKQRAERQKEKAEQQKHRAEQKNRLLHLMQRVASAANEAEGLEEAFQKAVDATAEQTGWPVGHVYLRDKYLTEEYLSDEYLREESLREDDIRKDEAGADKTPEGKETGRSEEVLRSSGIWTQESLDQFEACRKATEQMSIAPGEGLPGQVFEKGKPAWIEDVTEEKGFLRSEVASEVGVKGTFAFPVSLEGEVVAVLEFYSEEAKAPSEDLLEAMEPVGIQLSRVVEREEAIRALAVSERRYRRLFEDAQEGIAISTPEGEILDANPAALEIFGFSPKEIRSINTTELYVDPEEREAGIKELEEKGAIKRREFRLYRASGEEFICQLSATVHYSEGGKPVALLTFFRDVTERKKAEEALKESEEQFRKLAEGALVGIGLLQEGTYEYANPALAQITGYSQEELLGKSLKHIIHPGDWPKVQKRIEKRLEGEKMGTPNEMRIETKSGETRLVEVAGTRIDYQGKPAVIGTMQDITERRRLQQEVLQVQEEERRRLGQDLHDGVASQLTGATLKLNILSRRSEGDLSREEIAENVQEVQDIINESAEDVRRLSRGLNPGGLAEGNLPSALKQLATNFEGGRFENILEENLLEGERALQGEGEEEKTGLSSLGEALLEEDEATHLYRIAQEAVNNARKYAEANEIVVRLRENEGALVLEVEDDGVGFDPSEVSKEGLGLRSMRHRAELLGAELDIDTAPGEGTLVRCRLPINDHQLV